MMEVLEKINKGLIIEGAVTLGKKIMRRNLPFDIYKYITPNSWRSITEITLTIILQITECQQENDFSHIAPRFGLKDRSELVSLKLYDEGSSKMITWKEYKASL